jgi:hypothetical protein
VIATFTDAKHRMKENPISGILRPAKTVLFGKVNLLLY